MSKEIVTVGGGNGSPVINEALLLTQKVDKINAVAAVFDSGGATGRRRLDSFGREIAYSDAMRNLFSLVSPDKRAAKNYQALLELFNHRDSRDRVLGQDIFSRFFDPIKGFSQIEEIIENLGIDLQGHVFPSSTKPTNIAFTTTSGRNFLGEHLLDEHRMSEDIVINMYLDPSVDAYTPAADAIANAQVTILSCGSLHGSVLSNFLPNGMKEALARSKTKLFLVTNLVSARNETHNLTPVQFAEIVEKYSGKKPDGLIVPEISRESFESKYPDVSALYNQEHSHFLGWNSQELYKAQDKGIRIITHRATKVVEAENGYKIVRHDPQKLSDALGTILTA
ncbi:MAG: hypothetical protein COX79_00155 [Candidatus Levybacteria bacterium CG_4_10_14_0_2_um_filter_36_16]|nr:MAG: hypothetical protein AUK12_04825 [Candidatus Levybacteria bacterium CG2_30_37_29]PIZ98015.1 MAG: hypothetical protein COX79_00155 [Candidatus Levybacteria bacterium CG_4_10_14_0_2_um_filter_36_16]